MKKKICLLVVCLGLALTLASCAAVNSSNSFQSTDGAMNQQVATDEAAVTNAPDGAQTVAEPTDSLNDPDSVGFNG